MADAEDPKPKANRDFSFAAIEAALEPGPLNVPKKWRASLREPHEDVSEITRRGPYKLNKDTTAKVIGGILLGLPLDRAALAAGIHRITLWRWFKAGREGIEPYAGFFAACVAADAQCERDLLKTIKEASLGVKSDHGTFRQWTAAAWILERRFRYIAPKMPWVPDPAETDPNAAGGGGVALADLVGAKTAMAVNTGAAEAPVDPDEKVKRLEAQMAEMRAELEVRRRDALGQQGDATPAAGPPA